MGKQRVYVDESKYFQTFLHLYILRSLCVYYKYVPYGVHTLCYGIQFKNDRNLPELLVMIKKNV